MNVSTRAMAIIAGSMLLISVLVAFIIHFVATPLLWTILTFIIGLITLLLLLWIGSNWWHAIRKPQLERKAIAQEIDRENRLVDSHVAARTLELDHKQEIEREKIRLEGEKIRLEQMRLTLEHERLVYAQQHITVPTGSMLVSAAPNDYRTIAYNAPAQIAQRAGQQVINPADDFVKPIAPDFIAMRHLITVDRMPLCWTDKGPAYGTIDDLLSMAVTGKPGRGKTTALMYYVALLLAVGAEVFVWDPHGAMGELAVLNNRPLPGMPKTAKIVYLDRKDDIVDSVPVLQAKLAQRDEIYRECQRRRAPFTEHPLLLLADELPVLSDYDDQVTAEFSRLNKQLIKNGEEPEEVPSLIYVIRRFVLEARKWRCFFIGSGQSIDAEILPTKVTDALNSRIVFFNSDRKARMSGLETDAIKNLLPLLRRAGSGVMIFDCARWDEPVIGAIPNISIGDLLDFLGVVVDTIATSEITTGPLLDERVTGEDGRVDLERNETDSRTRPNDFQNNATMLKNGLEIESEEDNRAQSKEAINGPVDGLGVSPNPRPIHPEMNEKQTEQFIALYPILGKEKALDQIPGCNHRHRVHAQIIIEKHGLKRKVG